MALADLPNALLNRHSCANRVRDWLALRGMRRPQYGGDARPAEYE